MSSASATRTRPSRKNTRAFRSICSSPPISSSRSTPLSSQISLLSKECSDGPSPSPWDVTLAPPLALPARILRASLPLPSTFGSSRASRPDQRRGNAGRGTARDRRERLKQANQILYLATSRRTASRATGRRSSKSAGCETNHFRDDPRPRQRDRKLRVQAPSRLGSHEGSMVEVGGIEPPSPGDRSGLLRAQPAEDLASRLPPAERLSASPGEVSDGGPRAEPLP
jgi:hypothetical protein